MKKGFIIDDLNRLKKQLKRLPAVAGVVAVKYFKGRIDEQEDVNNKPFTGRNYTTGRQAGKKVLHDKGNMQAAIRVIESNDKRILIGISGGTTEEYAEAHNEGATIEITKKMRGYFWAMHKKMEGKPDADFYRNMAIKKTPILIPKREFIGNSRDLEQKIDKAIRTFLKV